MLGPHAAIIVIDSGTTILRRAIKTGGMNYLIIALLVAVRITATTWANVRQKRLLQMDDHAPLSMFLAVWQWMTLLTIPLWLATFGLGPAFWIWLSLACLLEVPGNVLLLRSLQQTELSIFGPLSSIKPAISLLLAFLLFGEVPSWFGAVGVSIVLAGSILLTTEPRGAAGSSSKLSVTERAQRRRGVRDRLTAVVLTALASLFLRRSIDYANEWQVLAAWCLASWLIAALWALASGRKSALQLTRNEVRPHLMIAVAMLAMQGTTIALFARMPVGYALALFQIGSLASVFVGHRLFGEAHLVRRVIASIIMIVGAAIILLGG